MDFERLINPLLEPFSNPESRTYWVGLFITFCVVVACGYHKHKTVLTWKAIKTTLSKSTHQLDAQLYIGRQLLFAIIGVPTLWSAWTISTHSFLWLKEHIGIPSPPDLSVGGKNAIYALTLFVAWDLSRFLLHWLMHKVPALWAFHQVQPNVATAACLHTSTTARLYRSKKLGSLGCSKWGSFWRRP